MVLDKFSPNMSEFKRCAVFGSNGYIGSQLSHLLERNGLEVTMFDIHDSALCLKKAAYIRFNVGDPSCWHGFQPDNYDAIFFFAGLTGTDRSFSSAEDFLAVNEGGLLGLCRKLAPLGAKAPKVIFPSTRLIYRGSPLPLVEDSEKETKTLYAVNKLACENMLHAYHNLYGLPYVVMRICVPYGNVFPTEYAYGTIGFFLGRARQGLPITLFGGGLQQRTFSHVADVCEACIRVAGRKGLSSGAYNIGGEALSLHRAALMIAEKFGVPVCPAEWDPIALRLESGDTVFDDARLVSVIGAYSVNDFKGWIDGL